MASGSPVAEALQVGSKENFSRTQETMRVFKSMCVRKRDREKEREREREWERD